MNSAIRYSWVTEGSDLYASKMEGIERIIVYCSIDMCLFAREGRTYREQYYWLFFIFRNMFYLLFFLLGHQTCKGSSA